MSFMHIGDLDLNLIPVFDALLQECHVSRAADRLNLSQSAMSHALRRLRTYFNDPLFVRVEKGMAPTPKAQELAPVVRGMMESLHGYLLPRAGFDSAQATREFSLCMTDMAEAGFMPRLIARLRKEAPGVRLQSLRILPRDAAQALERREVDLVLGSYRLKNERLFQQKLVRHPLICLVGANNPHFRDGMSTEAYLAAEHIGVSPFGLGEDLFEWVLQEHNLHRKFFMMTQGFLTIPPVLAGTDLVATVPQPLAEVFSGYPGICFLPPPVDALGLVVRQTWHPLFHHDPANIWLRQIIFELFSQPETFSHS